MEGERPEVAFRSPEFGATQVWCDASTDPSVRAGARVKHAHGIELGGFILWPRAFRARRIVLQGDGRVCAV